MTRSCPLCEQPVTAAEVYDLHCGTTPVDERPDYVTLKRELEGVLDCRLTVACVKRHFHEHISYALAPGGAERPDAAGAERGRGSDDDHRSGGWHR